MAEYLSPDVYTEVNPNPPVIESVSASNGGFIGVTERGVLDFPVFITSWNAFINNFAFGMSSPFLAHSDLAYAVYGFFQNGGRRCYIKRVASSTIATATLSLPEDTPTLVVSAKDGGAWGNKLSLTVTPNTDEVANFDVAVTYDGENVEVFKNLSNDENADNFWGDVLESESNFLVRVSGALSATPIAPFTGGADGVEDITDVTFTDALAKFDTVDDVNLLSIPGQTSEVINKALAAYCENRNDVFAVIDAPKASTVASVRELRKTLSCKVGALFFPYINVSDPLSTTGKLRAIPVCGHIQGVYARTIADKGVWEAPAGTEALVRGAISVTTTLTKGDLDVLNPIGVISIVPKKNYGIVVWGVRSLSPDSSMKYVTDILLDITIRKSVYNSTQPFVFKGNGPLTWSKVITTVQDYLDGLWRAGAFVGATAQQAYFVKCDEDLNPESVQKAGKMICEVGYASTKPAEFVIFRFSHTVAQ